MTEFEEFKKSIEDKRPNTIRSYILQYNKLHDAIDKDISKASQKTILLGVKTVTNVNTQQSMLNVAIMIRRSLNLDVNELIKTRDRNRHSISDHVKEKNITITDGLPSYENLLEYLEELYKENMFVEYVINYLLIHYQTRNQDLVFDIVRLKRDMKKDTTKNYIWISHSSKKAVYWRNDYKTAGVYGKKEIVITDPKFVTAIKRVEGCKAYKLDCGNIVPNTDQVGYWIKSKTLNKIGEGKIVKIVIDHFRGDMQKLKEISESRGTSLETLIESYDIQNKKKV